MIIVGIIITFTTGTRNFTPVSSGDWCFYAYISNDWVVLIPAIFCTIYFAASIIIINSSYIYIYFYVKKVRRNVRQFEKTEQGISHQFSTSIVSSELEQRSMHGEPMKKQSNRPSSTASSHMMKKHQNKEESVSTKILVRVDEAEQRVFRLGVAILLVLMV